MNNNYFNELFCDQNCSYFKNMMQIFERSRLQEYKNRYEFLEEHHIIPRCWFKMNSLPCDNSLENKVYLSCKDHLKVHVLLVNYFSYLRNEVMYKKMMSAIWIMTKVGSHQMKRYGDISKEEYEEYSKIKERYYQEGIYKNKKYKDSFIRECFDLYKQFKDSHEGFEYVKNKMKLTEINSEHHLIQRFKKYIPLEELTHVRDQQKKYMRECKKSASEEKRKKNKDSKKEISEQKTQEKIEKYKLMYSRYQIYGARYMKMRYTGFKTSQFLNRCGKYGIIDYKPSKDTTKKRISFEGQEYGLCELCRKLNISGNDYQKIISVHTSLGVDYDEIFQQYEKGNLDDYKISRKDNVKHSSPSLKDTLLEIARLGEIHGYDYVKVCEMHMSGISVEDIHKEVRETICHNIFPEENESQEDIQTDDVFQNLRIKQYYGEPSEISSVT